MRMANVFKIRLRCLDTSCSHFSSSVWPCCTYDSLRHQGAGLGGGGATLTAARHLTGSPVALVTALPCGATQRTRRPCSQLFALLVQPAARGTTTRREPVGIGANARLATHLIRDHVGHLREHVPKLPAHPTRPARVSLSWPKHTRNRDTTSAVPPRTSTMLLSTCSASCVRFRATRCAAICDCCWNEPARESGAAHGKWGNATSGG